MGLFWLKSLYGLIPIGWHKGIFIQVQIAVSQPINKHNPRKEREDLKSGGYDPSAKQKVRRLRNRAGNLGH